MRALVVLAMLSLLLLYVWERVDVVQVGYRVERLKAQRIVLERERDELRVKASKLTSPERIAKVAADKLAMTLPQQGQVKLVRLEPEIPAKPGSKPTEIRLAKNELIRKMP